MIKQLEITPLENSFVLDYRIVSINMFEVYQDFEVVETDPLFSDGHCLLRSILQFDFLIPNEEKTQIFSSKPKWKPEYKNDSIQHIDCIKINSLLQTLENTNINKYTINNVTNQIGEIFRNATSKAFQNLNAGISQLIKVITRQSL